MTLYYRAKTSLALAIVDSSESIVCYTEPDIQKLVSDCFQAKAQKGLTNPIKI